MGCRRHNFSTYVGYNALATHGWQLARNAGLFSYGSTASVTRAAYRHSLKLMPLYAYLNDHCGLETLGMQGAAFPLDHCGPEAEASW